LSSIQNLFLKGRTLLGRIPHADPALESRLLLQKAAGLSEKEFLTSPDWPVPVRAERLFLKMVARRLARIPLCYLTGEKEFWSIPLVVFPGVFIPRPESELLVEKVLELSNKRDEVIVDIGTGSGNIAIALARELPRARIIGVDISRRALKAARLNAERYKTTSIVFSEGNAFYGLRKFATRSEADFIVSNPPYVSLAGWQGLEPEIRRFEPKRALVSGATGYEFIRRLIKGASFYLKPGGYLLFEIGQGQAGSASSLFDSRGWRDIRTYADIRGIPRVVAARKT
jgi:release factor glutamine methyltransferase